jgi:GDP-D-mannose dehydratase
MRTALVCGAGGFIGSHLVRRLKSEGFWVRGVDLKHPEFSPTAADDFVQGDLRDPLLCRAITDRRFDEVYQLAADMGGAGYIFTGENDADIMHNSATINLNMLDALARSGVGRVFYSSSACIYPERNQTDPDNPNCAEDSAYPAAPDTNTAGRSCSASASTSPMAATTACRSTSPASTTSSAPKAPGAAARRRPRPPSAARSPRRRTAAPSRSGATAARPAPSSTSTNASKAPPA